MVFSLRILLLERVCMYWGGGGFCVGVGVIFCGEVRAGVGGVWEVEGES